MTNIADKKNCFGVVQWTLFLLVRSDTAFSIKPGTKKKMAALLDHIPVAPIFREDNVLSISASSSEEYVTVASISRTISVVKVIDALMGISVYEIFVFVISFRGIGFNSST